VDTQLVSEFLDLFGCFQAKKLIRASLQQSRLGEVVGFCFGTVLVISTVELDDALPILLRSETAPSSAVTLR
jgi:hypothetical protein